MNARVRFGLPLLVGGVVFAVGAVVEIDSFTLPVWLFFLIGGLVIPVGLLAFAYFMPFRTAQTYFRHARTGLPQPEVGWYSADRPRIKGCGREPETSWGAGVEGVKYAVITAVPVLAALTVLGYMVWQWSAGFPSSPVYWFLTAVAVAVVTRAFLSLFRLKRPVLAGALACGATVVVFLATLPYWKPGRDQAYYRLLLDRASHSSGQQLSEAAEHMIAFRPNDWRGYAWRVDAAVWAIDLDARSDILRPQGKIDFEAALLALLSDIESAGRLGCDDIEKREQFAAVYEALGRYASAASELEAAIECGIPDVTYTGGFNPRAFCRSKLGWARLHTGEYASAEVAFRSITFGQEGLSLSLMARGEYAAARKQLEGDGRNKGSQMTLAWLLATCPDNTIRDPGKAVEVAEAVKPMEPWIDLRDSDRPLCPRPKFGWGDSALRDMMKRARAFTLAAAYTNLNRFEEAETAFAEATEKGRLGVHGFWKPRRAELAECIKARKPYRDRPVN